MNVSDGVISDIWIHKINILTKNFFKKNVFPVTIKTNKININIFRYEDKQPYPVYISKEQFTDYMELLLITEENKTLILIKDFSKFM